MRQLQDQVSVLSENQAANDERYSRVKADNVTLTAKIHVLEENIREIEMRGEERLVEEQRRNRSRSLSRPTDLTQRSGQMDAVTPYPSSLASELKTMRFQGELQSGTK